MWKDFQWSGVGVGAFKLQAPFYVEKDDWAVLPPRPERGPNGYFSVMAERGIVGSLFFIVGIGFLVFVWVSRLVQSIQWHKMQEEGRAWIFCVPPVVWAGIAVLLAGLADMWFTCGFPLTALPLPCAAAMALAAASFPKLKRKSDKES
jgi:O-antigen ligase